MATATLERAAASKSSGDPLLVTPDNFTRAESTCTSAIVWPARAASADGTTSANPRLAETIPDTKRMFGARDEVDPVRFLIGAATGWGANPARDATYVPVVPPKNDGTTVHGLRVKDVPVDGF